MPESEAEIESLVAALRDQYNALSLELSDIEDEERKVDISAELSTIEEQVQHLQQQREDLRRARARGAV
jgi:predicted  nucleic acid-binding Zn-ribbon protein